MTDYLSLEKHEEIDSFEGIRVEGKLLKQAWEADKV